MPKVKKEKGTSDYGRQGKIVFFNFHCPSIFCKKKYKIRVIPQFVFNRSKNYTNNGIRNLKYHFPKI